jgi:hypothetical protein
MRGAASAGELCSCTDGVYRAVGSLEYRVKTGAQCILVSYKTLARFFGARIFFLEGLLTRIPRVAGAISHLAAAPEVAAYAPLTRRTRAAKPIAQQHAIAALSPCAQHQTK